MTTKHKAYIRLMMSTRWKKLPFYRFYMLREGTAIPAIRFSVELITDLFALKHGVESWVGPVASLQNPVVVVPNIIALTAVLLYTKTRFELTPRVASVIVENERMEPGPITKGLWTITVVTAVVILFVAPLQ